MSERNPISIDQGKKKRTSAKAASTKAASTKASGTKTSSRNSAGKSEGSPAPAKRAGRQAGSDARSSGKSSGSKKNATVSRTVQKGSEKTAKTEQNSTSAPARLPENRHPGLHERSYAAHLDAGVQGPHTKPAGDLRFLAPFPTGRKQP